MEIKHLETYILLDNCLSNLGRSFNKNDLLEYLNENLEKKINKRTLESRLKEMRIACGNVSLVDNDYIYKYPKGVSINKTPLTEVEKRMLKNSIKFLKLRIELNSNTKWITELNARLESDVFLDLGSNKASISFQKNEYLVGFDNFDKLVEGIFEKQLLKLEYQKFGGVVKEYSFSPQHLKQYNNRWFVFGKVAEYETITNFSLDRIKSIVPIIGTYKDDSLDWGEYFDDIIGVTFPKNGKVEKVILEIENSTFDYIKTKPLHHTQKSLNEKRTETHNIIQLELIINYELESILKSYGSKIKVLEPKSLVNKIKKELVRGLKQYEKK